jgi:hypothetical protein
MPEFLTRARDFLTGNQKDTLLVNRYEGFTANGAVVLRDRRGTVKAEIPDVAEKGMHGMGDDPMDLLEGVNENMTGIELKYVTMAHLELTGNCYWPLERE